MQSLIQQAADLAALGNTLREPLNETPCPYCKPERGCWIHPFYPYSLIRARVMPRAAWYARSHILRERARQLAAQDADCDEQYPPRAPRRSMSNAAREAAYNLDY